MCRRSSVVGLTEKRCGAALPIQNTSRGHYCLTASKSGVVAYGDAGLKRGVRDTQPRRRSWVNTNQLNAYCPTNELLIWLPLASQLAIFGLSQLGHLSKWTRNNTRKAD